ncbi:hypothetical protein C8R44DRAFT_895294 [Mycena epipterygia]|nr:hypothetical protein C8R44DRAFT_895294 [Mycena epipterygia]
MRERARRVQLSAIQCYNPAHVSFSHFFPSGQAPAPAIAALLTAEADRRPRAHPSSSTTATDGCPMKNCKHTRVARMCDNQLCKSHCESRGGCRIHPPPQASLPPFTGASLEAFKDIKSFANAILNYYKEMERRAEQERVLAATPSPTLSQVETDHRYALLLSSEDTLHPFLARPASPMLQSGASTSRPSSLYSAHSSSSTPSSSSAPVAHEATLFFWAVNAAPVVIQAIQDQDCLVWPQKWPRMRLLDIEPLLKSVEHPQMDTTYECYSFTYHSWMRISSTYVHDISAGQPLLIRRLGVVGSDEREHLRRLGVHSSLLKAPSPRTEHAIPEGKGKKRAIVVDTTSDDSDDEVIFVGYTRSIKKEPATPPRAGKRPRLSVQIPTITRPSLSESSTTMDTPGLSYSATTTNTSALPSPGSSPYFPTVISPYKASVRSRRSY